MKKNVVLIALLVVAIAVTAIILVTKPDIRFFYDQEFQTPAPTFYVGLGGTDLRGCEFDVFPTGPMPCRSTMIFINHRIPTEYQLNNFSHKMGGETSRCQITLYEGSFTRACGDW